MYRVYSVHMVFRVFSVANVYKVNSVYNVYIVLNEYRLYSVYNMYMVLVCTVCSRCKIWCEGQYPSGKPTGTGVEPNS